MSPTRTRAVGQPPTHPLTATSAPTRHPDHLRPASSRRSHQGDLAFIWRAEPQAQTPPPPRHEPMCLCARRAKRPVQSAVAAPLETPVNADSAQRLLPDSEPFPAGPRPSPVTLIRRNARVPEERPGGPWRCWSVSRGRSAFGLVQVKPVQPGHQLAASTFERGSSATFCCLQTTNEGQIP